MIVEVEEKLADALCLTLDRRGHDPIHVATAAAALREFPRAQFILLDLELPDLDGHELCRQLRELTDAPIIALSGRASEIDRLLAFSLGADDYVGKPFSYYELLARIDAVVRRASRSIDAPRDQAEALQGPDLVLSIGDLRMDLRARRVTVGNRQIRLTRKEFDLLTILMEDCGMVRTREEILAKVWDENWFGSTRTLDVHVGSLRHKLGDRGWIETVRGVGYRIDVPVPAGQAPTR
ncbi:MAG: response regulator transcription factor [Streptosporangiaceae bacterium]